jgi:uncharacterized membrane protein YvlD (DUF360 family)
MGGGLPPKIAPPIKPVELWNPLSVYLRPQGSEANMQWPLEMFRAGTTTGAEAIKAAILINGGAAVAVLAFISHLTKPEVARFAVPLFLFVGGVFASAVASGVTYLVHWCYVAGWNRGGWWVNFAASLLVAASLCLFGFGCICAFSAFNSDVSAPTGDHPPSLRDLF